VQQLLAAGQESIRAVVLSCVPGKLLMNLLLDKAWELQQDDKDPANSTAAAAVRRDAAAVGHEDLAVARSLQLQLRIIREQQQQQQQKGSTTATHSPAAVVTPVPDSNAAADDPDCGPASYLNARCCL
jgi:hypothetical protein